MQICPWCRNEPHAPAETARSRSASSSTIRAELPPSSRWARLRCRPAASPTLRPAAVDPVKLRTRTCGSATSAWPTSAAPGSTCRTPSGRPASWNTRARVTPPDTAVRGSGLSTTALPSASAGATERMARISGKLNGAMTPTTPTGRRRARLIRGWFDGMISPRECDGEGSRLVALLRGDVRLEARLGRDRTGLADDPALYLGRVLRLPQAARPGAARRHAPRNSSPPRPAGRRPRGLAAATSPASARPIRPRTSPVAGSTTAASPPSAVTQPPLKRRPARCRRRGVSRMPPVLRGGRWFVRQVVRCRVGTETLLRRAVEAVFAARTRVLIENVETSAGARQPRAEPRTNR